jgi:hypothetical protein
MTVETQATTSTMELPLPVPAATNRCPDLRDTLASSGTGVVLMCGSRDPNAKTTLVLLDDWGPAFVVKVPTTRGAETAVRREARALEALAGMPLGPLSATIPRAVGQVSIDGRTALLSTALPGRSMAVGYHGWRHTARRRTVERDFAAAAEWLGDLQARTAGAPAPVSLLTGTAKALRRRYRCHPNLAGALRSVERAAGGLRGYTTVRTAVHGDYWYGNLLLDRGRVTGVVDWECGEASGEPLRDIARFAVSYALYLDRHTRAGARVPGHGRLRAGRWGVGVDHLLAGGNWFSEVTQNFLTLQLGRLGVPPDRWRDVVIGGLAEIAATADDPDFAANHLRILDRAEAARDAAGPGRR